MKDLRVFMVLMFCWTISEQLKLPDYIKPCHRYAPDINQCILKSAEATIPHILNGDPKYKVPPLDPILIKELVIQQGSNSVGLTMVTHDALMYGIRDVVFKDLNFNFKNNSAYFEWFFPKIEIKLIYNVTGKVLLLPIEGYGNGTFLLEKVKAKYTYEWEIFKKKDGKEYTKVVRSKLIIDPERLRINLENLFNGNKLLGDNMNIFMNENWKEILKEMGPAISEGIADYTRALINNIYSLVPLEDVYIFDPV